MGLARFNFNLILLEWRPTAKGGKRKIISRDGENNVQSCFTHLNLSLGMHRQKTQFIEADQLEHSY